MGGGILGGGIAGLARGLRPRSCNLIWWMIELGKGTKIMFRSIYTAFRWEVPPYTFCFILGSCLWRVWPVCLGSFTGGGIAQIVLLMYLHTYLLLSKARKALH
jgi:hypothetical protein